MDKIAREGFNKAFSEKSYQRFIASIEAEYKGFLDFRIAESPVFIPKELTRKLIETCEEIITSIKHPDFLKLTERATPADQNVPNENSHTSFLAIDFAVCQTPSGILEPQLIELQGFPSMFGYQDLISSRFQEQYPIPKNFKYLFNSKDSEEYFQKLEKLILGNYKKEEVILLELYPETQKTRIDFEIMRKKLGIKTVCYTKIIKEGKSLYYLHENQKIQIRRIYNRLIFDELRNHPQLKTDFKLTDDVNVEWVGHPNWFFRISKFAMPYLKGDYIPETKFVSDYQGNFPNDIEQYVLKPLFSFAGSGVQLHVSKEMLLDIVDPENYILQRKVTYEPVIASPEGNIKCEIRMMYGWPDKDSNPELLISLSRLSRGEMIGVSYNKDFSWVGSSTCFFEN